MKKLFMICSLFISALAVAQNPVPNAGFENWTNNEPDNWLTLNIPGMAVSCQQTNISHSGASALKGIVVPLSGGLLWPPYIVSTNQEGDPFPVNQKFTNLSFYYQLDLHGTGEFFEAMVAIADDGENGIGGGSASFYANANTGLFTLASVPIAYITGTPAGAFISFAIYDTLDGAGVVSGSYYIIDDLILDYMSGVEAMESNEMLKAAYPNPASQQLNIPFVVNGSTTVALHVYDLTGRKVSEREYGTLQAGSYKEVIDVAAWVPGIYVCEMITSAGRTRIQFAVMGVE